MRSEYISVSTPGYGLLSGLKVSFYNTAAVIRNSEPTFVGPGLGRRRVHTARRDRLGIDETRPSFDYHESNLVGRYGKVRFPFPIYVLRVTRAAS